MLNRKAMKILFKLLFMLVFFANHVVMPEVCFCGTCCPYSLQNNANAKVKTLFHDPCPPGKCNGCDIVYYNKVKASNFHKSTFRITNLSATSFLPNLSYYSCPKIAFNNPVFFDTPLAGPSLPIFLQNLSIRC